MGGSFLIMLDKKLNIRKFVNAIFYIIINVTLTSTLD